MPAKLIHTAALLCVMAATSPHSSSAQDSTRIAQLLGLAKTPPVVSTAAGERKRLTAAPPVPAFAAGLPENLSRSSAFSAGLASTFTQPGNSSSAAMMGDWDGREDRVADHSARITQLSGNSFFTRLAISEHTVANGFNENVIFGGDGAGNLFILTDTTGSLAPESTVTVNIPTLIATNSSGGVTLQNPSGADFTSGSGVITGIAVCPVADLGDFGAAFSGVLGEIVYVSFLDLEGGAANASNQPFHTRIFALGFTDAAGGVTSVGARQLLRSQFYCTGGVCVDDDGSLYFHLADLLQKTNGAIFKATETSRTVTGAAVNPRINRAIPVLPTISAITSAQGTASSPFLTNSGIRLSSLSGPSTLFGNVVAICAGPDNRIYAAVAASFDSTASAATQATQGPFAAPGALGATPSMVICFSDRVGGVETGGTTTPDGLADLVAPGETRTPGINNFTAYALGNGPDRRTDLNAIVGFAPAAAGKALAGAPVASPVFGSTDSTLKLDMQIDYSIHAGIAVDEDGKLFVISGGSPAGMGQNPSPTRSEILGFVDQRPRDLRADSVDFRGDQTPNPPASGGNVGDGDSDRFDHIFLVAPLDGVSFLPQGISGLARGFLRYTARLAPNAMSAGITLGQSGGQAFLADDAAVGPIQFDLLDPGHQVAGGDDQNTPFRGDDDDGAGVTPIAGALNGGFEFAFGPAGAAIRNDFFLNPNGNLTFVAGSNDNTPTVNELRTGPARIAPAWSDFNFNARNGGDVNSFPLTALGFAGINAFKVRYINVPEFNKTGSTNTFSVTLYDDGAGIDENANQPLNPANPIGNNAVPFDLQEGPTDLRFLREPNSGVLVGENPRKGGTGYFAFDYGGMTSLGRAANPVLAGYSIGGLAAGNPPGLADLDLGEAAVAADEASFAVIQSQTLSITKGLIGDGTEPALHEFFNTGDEGTATSALDLRSEGADAGLSTLASQADLSRERVAFYGSVGAVPPVPLITVVQAVPKAVTAGTTAVINAYCDLPINILGSGFFPNATTTVSPGTATERAGKTISTAAVMTIDPDQNGVADFTVPLLNVAPVSENLITATIPTMLPGSPFPLDLVSGFVTITVTTTFTSGDNNVVGAFTRTVAGVLSVGNRAPVISAIAPTTARPAVGQAVQITGASFKIGMTNNVTRVYAVRDVRSTKPQVPVEAASFTIDSATQISATFNFNKKQTRQQFLIFAEGPNGTSRNAKILPPGADPACPLGNEQGNLIKLSLTP